MSFSLSPLFAGFIVAEWALRIIMLFIVPKKQRPSSANAWLLFIMIAPSVGTLLFLLLGNPKLTKIRTNKRKEIDALTKKELLDLKNVQNDLLATIKNDDHGTIAKLATFLSGFPPMNGNKVEFINDYNEVFSMLVKEIDKAKHYVHIQYYIAVLDESTKQVFDSLENAVKRGVTIRFLYDRVMSRGYRGHKAMRSRLEQIGVEYHEMLPLSLVPGKNFTRPDLRNHRKIVIIDGDVAYSGSQNLIDRSYQRKDGIYYEEVVVKLQGPIVWQCNNVFRSDWYAETGQTLHSLVEDSDIPDQSGSVIAQVLPSGPSYDHDNNLKLYTSMVHSAKNRVGIVVPYFIPDESFLDALIGAAQRGVDVTLINSEAIDKIFAGHAQRSYYDELLASGIKIYLYKKPIFLHTKQVIIDDEVAIVGSSNLDIRSFELDLEVSMILYDKEVVKRLDKIEASYLEKSTRINKKKWQKRPLRLKMLESIARLTSALQ
jgi:cardiolipin synthase A/B